MFLKNHIFYFTQNDFMYFHFRISFSFQVYNIKKFELMKNCRSLRKQDYLVIIFSLWSIFENESILPNNKFYFFKTKNYTLSKTTENSYNRNYNFQIQFRNTILRTTMDQLFCIGAWLHDKYYNWNKLEKPILRAC